MKAITILACSLFLLAAERVERWGSMGTGEIDGQIVTYAVDQTWHGGSGDIRTSHWQLVYVNDRPGQARDYRFVDRVDCRGQRRAPLTIWRYDDDGNLLSRKDYPEASLRWESIANQTIEAKADLLTCLDR